LLDRLCMGTREPNRRDLSGQRRHIQTIVVYIVLGIFRHGLSIVYIVLVILRQLLIALFNIISKLFNCILLSFIHFVNHG
jgi:hypothetical protein